MSERSERIAGLRTIVVESGPAPEVVAVMLHGYAMTPEALSPFAHSLGVAGRFFLPEAPLAATPAGRAWWDIDLEARAHAMAAGPRDLSREHPPGLAAARALLVAFLSEVRLRSGGLPVALVGFSQGGMLACDAFLREQLPIAALALLSASRIASDEWEPLLGRVKDLPVLVSHGERDPDLAFAAGQALRDLLQGAGAHVTWVPFEQGHEIPLLVWRALRKLLLQLRRAP